MYELYFIRRLLAEQKLAEQSDTLLERSIHLQACRYYRDLIDLQHNPDGEGSPDEAMKP